MLLFQIQPHISTSTTTNSKLQQNNTPPTTPPVLNQSPISQPIINGNAVHPTSPTNVIPVSEPPSYASTMAYKAAQQQPRHLPPPPCIK